MIKEATTSPEEKIAIIGMACRFPGGASDPQAFWANLVEGKDCITPTPSDRYDVSTLRSDDKTKPGKLIGGRGGYIDDFDRFDPGFFGISPREADYMDPQQRKLLEVAWEALEDGGQKPFEMAGQPVGVFVGGFTLDYKILQFSDLSFNTLAAHTATGTMMTMLSNRISYCFDFCGPSLSIDTACSSSLVAVHLACQSLRRRESCLALAGASLLHMAPQYTIGESKGGFLSAQGKSRTFDAAANGYVRSEGVGMVVLKRLDDALRDGDRIHAVVVGSGVNQDGHTNGITVPSADAQVRLIERVCAEAGIEPGTLQYIEAHGTSTPVGDPIEAGALGRVLSIGRPENAKSYVGSVKTNMGHAEAAAGMAGLIKVAMSLKHKQIPPHINLETINPAIDLASLPFEIPTRLTEWPAHEGPARAGVNSFGFGGTNAHVVLEEAPAHAPTCAQATPASPRVNIMPLTAQDPVVFPEMVKTIRQKLSDGLHGGNMAAALSDLGYTLAQRRQHLGARLSFVYDSPEALDAQLAAFVDGKLHPLTVQDICRTGQQRLAWVFTGMGPQWWGMGRELFNTEPVYRAVIERCDREIAKLGGWSLINELNATEANSQMSETWLAQPANFALQAGLAALWRSHGVQPDAIVGHSTGEVAAFYEAGVYSFEQAIEIVFHRSRLQQELVGTGGMLAVGLSESEAHIRVKPYGDRISIAAVNSPTAITLAGDEDALAKIAEELKADRIFAKALVVRVPYHSAKMELIKKQLLQSLAGLEPRVAQVPLYTTARAGTAIGPELDAHYWWHNVRQSVSFRTAIDAMMTDGYDLFLEIGPHPVLTNAIQECFSARGAEAQVLPSIRRNEAELVRFTTSLAALHNRGIKIDWSVLHRFGQHVTLPNYPWKRDRFWIEPVPVEQVRLGHQDHILLGRRMACAEPTWEVGIDAERHPYLNDHRIQGNVLFPAAGYIEMAMQAAHALSGGTSVAVTDIEFRKALFLQSNEAKTVQLSLASDGASFNVSSMPGAGQERVMHAAGGLRTSQPRAFKYVLDADAVRQRALRHLAGPACYEALADLGYHYGAAFQGIEEVWIAPGEALARIRPTAALNGDAAHHHFHPTMLDACFQALLTPAIVDDKKPGSNSGIRLPLSIAEVRTEAIGDQAVWVHATTSRTGEDELIGDVAVFADDGTPLGHIKGFRAGNIDKASSRGGLNTIDRWLADMTWVEAPLPLAEDEEKDVSLTTTSTDAGFWLIFADRQGVADALAAAAAASGRPCSLVRPARQFSLSDSRRDATVDPENADHIKRLLAELGQDGTTPPSAIIHMWSLDLPELDAATAPDIAAHGSYSLISLAQALSVSSDAAKLYVVTRGTQAVAPGDRVEPLGAPAWGIGRVLGYQELSARRGKLIDLAATAPLVGDERAEEVAALMRELRLPDGEDEIALRADRRYVSRLKTATGLTRPLPLRLDSDGCYLVTGAFGALGRLLCRLLVKRGARKLILVGRSKLPERSQWRDTDLGSAVGRNVRFIKELEALGAEAILAPLDITDEAALAAWLADFRQGDRPPIRGVFHLAGQVRDTLVAEMDRSTFDAAYDPKVIGAYLLHRYLADEPIEHFVLFASIAALLTTAGQTNYAAGNAFMDALAHHRRARGLPALSLDWGPWATGMIEELGLIDHYRNSRGMSSLSPEAGMDVLERVIGQDRAQLLVATVEDWPIFLAWYPSAPPLVSELAAQQPQTSTNDNGSFIDTFRQADEQERRALLTQRFSALISHVLRIDPAQIELNAGLTAFGMDSLLAMELRARVLTDLKVALPIVTLLSAATVGQLIDQMYADLIDNLSADNGSAASTTPVEQFDDEGRFPLTQNQKALWFIKQLDPDGFAYNIGGAVEVRMELDPQQMFEAMRQLIDRHPMLRANFMMDRGQAVQKISSQSNPDLALIDVEDRPWEEIYQMIIQEYRKPYDLEHDSLIRLRIFKRGPNRWVLMKAVHHIISDAISTFTFIEELLEIYEGLHRGEQVALAPVPARYLDFLNWQNRFLASREAQKMLGYWREHLPAEVPILNLPTDKPRPAVQTYNGASELFVLDEDLSARIHALARQNDVTVFMVLLSAYYIMLNRYCGQDDIIIGSPVTGRTQEEFASIYGYFVNPLPLHVNLAGAPSVSELLAQVQRVVLNGLDNQEYPFVLLVDELGLQHDPSRSAVFQVMFILLAHKVATEKYGYRLEYVELPEEEGQFDLTLSVYEDEVEQRFHCVFKYNSDLFEPETVRRMTGHYCNLLDALTRSAKTQSVAELPMLGGSELPQILDQWSGASLRAEVGPTVHQQFANIARQHPDAIAVVAPADDGTIQRLSYAELDTASEQLATRLRKRGVGCGSVVALCMDKSPQLIITLLAVLKAGAAYLPLDPDYPTDRLAYMLDHAGTKLAIADEHHRDRLAAWPGEIRTLVELNRMTNGGRTLAPSKAGMNDAAYVIYTSGSTGLPKAVRVNHGSLASTFSAWRQEYQLDSAVRTHLQMASFAFDVFAGDWVRALCSGGSLVLVSRDVLFNTKRLYELMLSEQVECAEFVPAVVRGLMSYCEREGKRLDFMRLLIVGSDVWKVHEYQQLRRLCGEQTRVVNSYGLSEATIDSTYFEGSAEALDPAQMVPIGRPFPNSAIYILDAQGQPVPAGVSGELWIGGDGVAAGYVGDPERTAQRFSTVTLGHGADARTLRLYRTGDLARWRSSGEVQLLGRIDTQVKVRGHRIEIGEIETQLAAWPSLRQAVVVTRPDSQGETTLCAYCVPQDDQHLNWRELREHLGSSLPTFMIPTYFVELPELPLSPNGKVDLGALPAPRFDTADVALEPPVTIYEVSMAEHWQRLLGLEKVGLQQDFFELGGSSIKLIELIYHLQTEFNIAISVSHLFKVTTLHGMAKAVESISMGKVAGAQPYLRFNAVEGNEKSDSPMLFCFPPAGGHGLVYRQLAAHLPEYEIVSFNYLLGDRKVERYADLIEGMRTHGECTLFGYSLGGNLAFEVAKELEQRGRKVPNVVIMDSYRIPESFEMGEEHFEAFERELTEHIRKHTGSEIVAQETLEQAREYIHFCSRTPNIGVIKAPVSVISDEDKLAFYAATERGTWHGSSTTGTSVVGGFGKHADMLDADYVAQNAGLARKILTGEAVYAN